MHPQRNHDDERSTLVRVFTLLGEARLALNEAVATAPDPTAGICAAMSERIYQEQERVRAHLRVSERRA